MQILGHKFNSSANADPDARRYLNAANIVPGQIYAGDGVNDYPLSSERIIVSVTNFIISLKSAGLFIKMRHMYAFLGNGNNNFVNLMHPNVRDLVPIPTTVTSFTRKGSIGSSNTMFNTGIRLSEFDENSVSAGIYLNGTPGGYTFGCTDTITGTYIWGMSGNAPWFKSNGSPLSGSFSATGGLFVMNQTAINRKTVYLRGSQSILDTTTTSSATHNSDYREIWLSQINFNDTIQGGANISGIGFFFMSTGLSDADNVALAPIINRFMYEINGRDVGETVYNTIQFFGDSITEEFNATGYHRWVNQVSCYYNATQANYGAAGTKITEMDPTLCIAKDSIHTKVFVSYSTNDFYVDYHTSGSSMNISLYISTYATKLAAIFAKGYSPSDVIIITGYYTDPEQYGAGADALHDQYMQAGYTVAANAGIPIGNVINCKPVMKLAGANPAPGDVHPTNFGHDVISNFITASLDNIGFTL